eukprot:TRINITY_DN15184_c0_g1_i1.p1 TRINITY_DN15184_c0_g1~~TRINITY_DN15184_c0_g1_i1.p1  ORF type:complete len:391 (-),score=49.33 TRINITY_DN15184_c0_g1_i1:39-1211(-)
MISKSVLSVVVLFFFIQLLILLSTTHIWDDTTNLKGRFEYVNYDRILARLDELREGLDVFANERCDLAKRVETSNQQAVSQISNGVGSIQQLLSQLGSLSRNFSQQLRAIPPPPPPVRTAAQQLPTAVTTAEVKHADLASGAHLQSPWVYDQKTGRLSLGSTTVFRLDSNGFVGLKPAVRRVQFHLGMMSDKEFQHFLTTSDSTTLLIIVHFPANAMPDSDRHILLPAVVWHVSGMRGDNVPAIRLEDVLQLLPPRVSVDLLRLDRTTDHLVVLSSGTYWFQLPRMVLDLQDIPLNHAAKTPGSSNTTLAIAKLRQKGFALICCHCKQASVWLMECYFGRRSFMNTTTDWSPAWTKVVEPECKEAYDRNTNKPIVGAGSSPRWSVPLCPR